MNVELEWAWLNTGFHLIGQDNLVFHYKPIADQEDTTNQNTGNHNLKKFKNVTMLFWPVHEAKIN